MDKEHTEHLWEVLSSAANIKNIAYGEAVTIGGVFGEMKTAILKQQEHIETLEKVKHVTDQSYSNLLEQLNQTNSTIRDMEEEYRKLHEQYITQKQAYEAVIRAI